MEIILKKRVIVNQEDIDDIMCTALEGGNNILVQECGINYK